LDPAERCDLRRKRVESALNIDLSLLATKNKTIGHADERNCEQMIGCVAVPVGVAGPLAVTFSSKERAALHFPLATTEGALVASVNRGCKAASTNGVRVSSTRIGTTRSLAFRVPGRARSFTDALRKRKNDWIQAAEQTSHHLKILSFDIDARGAFVFLTIACGTGDAMGMNMVTIAAQSTGEWIMANLAPKGTNFITVAGNVDSDKKPSRRTKEKGRGFRVIAETILSAATIKSVLKTTPQALLDVAEAKLGAGSTIAGALGSNLHAANVVAAIYLATGQDAAHVVEGSLADTKISPLPVGEGSGVRVRVELPAVLVGVRGGGTTLPAQSQCLSMVLKPKTSLPSPQQLAESIGAAVLAGEISLLAAQSTHTLAQAHRKLGR
jgi:hydroxymethylglutaryl-CoA reductase (NADPH)